MIRVLVRSDVPGLREALEQRSSLPVQWVFDPSGTGCSTADGSADEAATAATAVTVMVADPGLIRDHHRDHGGVAAAVPASVRWLHSTWAGVNALFTDTPGGHDVVQRMRTGSLVVTRLTGDLAGLSAEYVLGHLIAHERRFATSIIDQAQRHWPAVKPRYRPLRTLTITVLGATGQLGTAICRAAKAFGMTVVGYATSKRRLQPDEATTAHLDELFAADEDGALTQSLMCADYIACALPSTPRTRGLLGGDLLRACAARAPVLLSVGRGDVVDEASIVQALDNGWLSHAILDVFEIEPLPPTSALWAHPAVTITPHVSAISMAEDVATSFERQLARYLAQQPLAHMVDVDAGY